MKGRQSEVILAVLRDADGGWVSALELHEVSGSLAVHSRIANLRKQGHAIQNRARHKGGRCLSEYRYIVGTDPPPRELEKGGGVAASEPAPSQTEQGEFGLPLTPASTRWPD